MVPEVKAFLCVFSFVNQTHQNFQFVFTWLCLFYNKIHFFCWNPLQLQPLKLFIQQTKKKLLRKFPDLFIFALFVKKIIKIYNNDIKKKKSIPIFSSYSDTHHLIHILPCTHNHFWRMKKKKKWILIIKADFKKKI